MRMCVCACVCVSECDCVCLGLCVAVWSFRCCLAVRNYANGGLCGLWNLGNTYVLVRSCARVLVRVSGRQGVDVCLSSSVTVFLIVGSFAAAS